MDREKFTVKRRLTRMAGARGTEFFGPNSPPISSRPPPRAELS